MQKRMSFIARFRFLPMLLLTTALHGGLISQTAVPKAQKAQDPSEEPRGIPQLLAQNRPSQAGAADKVPGSDEDELDLSDQVIRDVLGPLRRGMQGHNLYQVLATFDQQGTPDYAKVRDQLRAFFYHYDEIRFHYQLLQVTSDKDQGSAVADIQIDVTPSDLSQATLRRETQMRFRLKLEPKGWKLVGFSPADFFAQ
jgi:hypothetical protein